MQIGFYFDQTRCTGCYACVVACKDWHDVPAGPASWIRVETIEKGKFPDLFVAFFTHTCYHCADPACVEACPAGAISGNDWRAGLRRERFFDAFACCRTAQRLAANVDVAHTICGICIAVCPHAKRYTDGR